MDVASFLVDHDRMGRGLYVSRRDRVGGAELTTFDLRMVTPNTPPYISPPAIHTLEHLLAVYLRTYSGDWAERVIYAGPMGCRTGMYVILAGALEPGYVLPLFKDAFRYISDFDGVVPASTSRECGNCMEHDLPGARAEAARYLELLERICPENMIYPKT